MRLGDGIDGANGLARLGDTNRMGKMAGEQRAAYRVIADRLPTQLEGLAHAAVF